MSTLICVDNGGTLTDAIAVREGRFFRAKAITTPHDLSQCFVESIAALSREIYGETALERLLGETEVIRYSTTQGTNALVQARDKGPRLGLLLPKGTAADALLGTPKEHELFAALVGERVATIGEAVDGDEVIAVVNALLHQGCNRIVLALAGDDRAERELEFRRHFLRCFPRHFLGAVPLLLAHQLSDHPDLGRRAWTALLNAFLHPTMEHFLYHAEGELRQRGMSRPLMVFRNDGNASRVAKTVALKTYSSGPRGGMEGARAYAQAYAKATGVARIVSFDVGGTTTDIGVATADDIDELEQGPVEGVRTAFPLCNILSAGIGGSSVLAWEGAGESTKDRSRVTQPPRGAAAASPSPGGTATGRFKVGPESVGAAPGPACFGRGGKKPTMTDVYLLSGWFDPETYFGGKLRIDATLAAAAVREQVAAPARLDDEAALLALDEAYHRAMTDAILGHVQLDAGTMLMAIGGAGPMSACRVAEMAGVNQVIVPHAASVFCAYGIGFSDLRYRHEAAIDGEPQSVFDALMLRAAREVRAEGYAIEDCEVTRTLLRDGAPEQVLADDDWPAEIEPGTRLRLDVVRRLRSFPVAEVGGTQAHEAQTSLHRECLLPDGRWHRLPLYPVDALQPGAEGAGPAVLEDAYTTVRLLPGWRFRVTGNRDLLLQRDAR